MESADEVRASLVVAALDDLTDHEATEPTGEERVAGLLRAAGVLSWPLVVDGESGLILDGSHRAHVLRRVHGARFVAVQRVRLADPAIVLGTWCRVVPGVPAPAFAAACERFGLTPGVWDGRLRCHYAGAAYGRADLTGVTAHALAQELVQALTPNGSAAALQLVDDDAAAGWLGATGTVVLRLPALAKAALRARPVALPPKSTRFVLPFRVIGLTLPLAALAGPREALEARLHADMRRVLVCLGEGLTVDRRYPERLWQLADYRIPAHLFADRRDQDTYRAALARASVAVPSHSSHSCHS